MQDRFRLRFESGDRQGESVPLSGPSVALGRRPDNAIQVADGSVSSRHAEFVVDASGVLLRDLESTNGTHVNGERLSGERRLAHGDAVVFGNVKFTLIDEDIAPSSSNVSSDLEATRLHEVSAERLERAEKRSVAGIVGLALLAGIGGGTAWYVTRGQGATGSSARTIVAVPGNLLEASFSFESERAADGEGPASAADPGWEADAQAAASFFPSARAASSGAQGLAASLGEGEWAVHRSPAERVTSGAPVEAGARFATAGGGRARLGLEFSSSSDNGRPFSVWNDTLASESFAEAFTASTVPPGYDRARVLLRASLAPGEPAPGEPGPGEPGPGDGEQGEAGGEVRFDDVSLAPAAGGAVAPKAVGEYQLAAAGPHHDTLVLFKISRALASGIRIVEATDTGLSGPGAQRTAELSVTTTANGFDVVGSNLGQGALVLFVEPTVAGDLATLGPSGLRAQRSGFDETGVRSCLFGKHHDLVRLTFGEPVRVTGRAVDGGFELRAELGDAGNLRFSLSVSFTEERAQAANLAADARDAENDGRLGEATRNWQTLLDEYPIEEALVQEAAGRRSALVKRGFEELAEVRKQVERAGFFQLAELYRDARDKARVVAERFAGSEVEVEARSLIESVDGLVVELETALNAREVERLREIRSLLLVAEMPRLAERVESYLGEQYGAKAEGEQ